MRVVGFIQYSRLSRQAAAQQLLVWHGQLVDYGLLFFCGGDSAVLDCIRTVSGPVRLRCMSQNVTVVAVLAVFHDMAEDAVMAMDLVAVDSPLLAVVAVMAL